MVRPVKNKRRDRHSRFSPALSLGTASTVRRRRVKTTTIPFVRLRTISRRANRVLASFSLAPHASREAIALGLSLLSCTLLGLVSHAPLLASIAPRRLVFEARSCRRFGVFGRTSRGASKSLGSQRLVTLHQSIQVHDAKL